jgi:DNA-binding XRE family transcriptional regulator/tetratricopeptide (TPR) repeat protein
VPLAYWIKATTGDETVKAKRHALAYRREIVGHTQETLAEFVGVEPTTVGRWERGETSPQPWSRPKLAEALAVSVEQLNTMLAEGQPAERRQPIAGGARNPHAANEPTDDPEHDPVLIAPWNHRGTVEAAGVLTGGDGRVKRRMFLSLTGPALTAPAHQWLVHEPEPLVSGLAGRRVPAGVADRLPAMIAELRAMDDVAGGGDVLSLAQFHFGWVAGLLDQASYDDATGRKLHRALAELGQLVGWLCYDTDQHGLAQRYHITALRASHAADDRPLGAHILGSLAHQCQGRPTEAVTLIDTAVAGTRGQQTPRLLAELCVRQAYAFAALKDASACATAISQALTYVERSANDDDPPYLYWVRPAEITAGAGYCLLQLGQADRAAAMIDQGIAMFDAPFDRDRQMYLTYLTEALARPGKQRDLEAAAGKGIEAIDLAANLSSTRSVDRIRYLSRQLKPYATVPAVRDFLERAKGFVKG